MPSEFGLFVSLDVEIAKGYGRQVVGKKTSKHIPTGNDMMEFYLGPSCYVIILTIPLREHPSRNRLLFFELSNPPAGCLGFDALHRFYTFLGELQI